MGNPLKFCVFGMSSILVAAGGLMVALWPSIYNNMLENQLSISPNSRGYEMWRETPVPIYMEVYLFNWTNPQEVGDPKKKPAFTELGPYVFSEKHEKVNISFSDNDSLVEHHQIRTWHFEPEMSNGSLSDNVTNVNVIALSAGYFERFASFFTLSSMNLMFQSLGVKLAVTKTAGELIFDGYEDPLLDVINAINNSNIPKIPFDKFGWFYMRNGSWRYDGLFEIHTGVDDLAHLGTMNKWNNKTSTNFYQSYCAMVNGTSGELFPPINHTNHLEIFATDLCRTMRLDYVGKTSKADIPANLYAGGNHLLDNGTLYPENACFCGSEHLEESCSPIGIANVSLCRYGSPAFISYPHFYLADPYYTDKVDIAPASEKDMFTMTVEPNTGIPIDVNVRLQINMLMQKIKYIDIFKKVPFTYMPMIYFVQRAEITPKLTSQLKLLLNLPLIGTAVFSTIISIGLVIFLVGVAVSIWGPWNKRKNAGTTPIDEDNLVTDEGEDEGE